MRLIAVVKLCLQIIIAGKKQVYIKISFTLQGNPKLILYIAETETTLSIASKKNV